MAWKIEYTDVAEADLKSIDKTAAKQIRDYLNNRIATELDPRRFGRSLQGNLGGYWRYRVGDYRILCEIDDGKIVVLVLHAGHRSNVYGGH